MHAVARRISQSFRTILSGVLSVILILGGGALAVTTASADALPQYLSVSKTVNGASAASLVPGEEFTYQIQVVCSEQDCANASVTDALPAELNGFPVVGFATSPAAASVPATVAWSSGSQPTVIGSDTSFTIDFGQSISGGATGLNSGSTFNINLTVKVPSSFSPDDARNGQEIVNTATVTATNSASDSASAAITVHAEKTLAATLGKVWTPATSSFDPGATSTIGLTGTNSSNVPVSSLVVQEPASAADGATSLSSSNPFTVNDFSGFDASSTLPGGADTVQVDAYVRGSDGTWGWVSGSPSSSYELPSGVDASAVGGLRFTYTGSKIAVGATANAIVIVAQRETSRDGADLSTSSHSVTNVASAAVSAAGASTTPVTASATRTVNPTSVSTTVKKTITPKRVPAGNTATASITATNSGSAVSRWKVSDTAGFFTSVLTFGGFTGGISYPSGATSGTVVYTLLSGGTEEVAFADGDVPAAPSSPIASFDLVFTSNGNAINANATVAATFRIQTSSDTDFGTATELPATTNTATSTVTTANNRTATATSSATLTLVNPTINVSVSKKALPSGAVESGDTVIVSIGATTSASTDYVTPTTITVDDYWGANSAVSRAADFWNAFNLSAIQPTQIPAHTGVAVQVQRADGSWVTIDTLTSQASSYLYSKTTAQLQAAISAASPGTTLDTVTGARFVFTSDTSFATSTTVRPYLAFTARTVQRIDGTSPVDALDTGTQVATAYTNSALVTSTGTTADGTTVSAGPVTGTASASVIQHSGPTGAPSIAKTWSADTVASQTGQTATTDLNWGVGGGYASVAITDPGADLTNVAATTFDAFNLTSIAAISSSSTPYSNGWYLQYDSIRSIELFYDSDGDGTSEWNTVSAPYSSSSTYGPWQNPSNGSFVGYTLSASLQKKVTGIRITLQPNDATRAAALSSGSDPYAPAVGSGVVSSAVSRTFTLGWQLRDTLRSSGAPVVGSATLNGGEGVVSNTVGILATPASGTPVTGSASDTIRVIDQPAIVDVTKSVDSSSAVAVQSSNNSTTRTFALTAKNASVTPAQYVRVTDPAPCSDTSATSCQSPVTAADAVSNPFTSYTGTTFVDTAESPNVFNRLTITGLTFSADNSSEVDTHASVVWLLTYTPSAGYEYIKTTLAAATALTAAQLVDVVGVSVTYQGTNPAGGDTLSNGNSLRLRIATVVRDTLRSTGASQITELISDGSQTVSNRVFAQSYELVASPNETGDLASAAVTFAAASVDAAISKSITSGVVYESDPTATQTVTISANQGASTASPTAVVIRDDSTSSASFWSEFDFAGLGDITFPSGANRVAIDVYGPYGAGGALAWKLGDTQSAGSTYTLPVASSEYDTIQGIRLTFSVAPTATDSVPVFSTGYTWSAGVTFNVQLRDTVRGTSEAVTFPENPRTDINVAAAQSFGTTSASHEVTAQAPVVISAGSHVLKLNKLANNDARTASVGSLVPWDITISNGGTGYLDLDSVVDTLPSTLVYTGSGPNSSTPAVKFTPDSASGSTLVTTPTVTPGTNAAGASTVTFTWPDGSRLQPGETATIRIWVELEPGAQAGEHVTNTVTAHTVQALDVCTDTTHSDGSADVTWNVSTPNECSTSDYITPTSGPNLYVVKGVTGSVAGAVNTTNPSQSCATTLKVDSIDYYRAPCAANSAIGGTDNWVLHIVNAGTTAVTKAIVFDAFPTDGDTYLISGTSRGSEYRPQLLDSLAVTGAPAGTTQTIEVTTSANVCSGTWATLPGDASTIPCTQSGETWAVANADTDWSIVTGVRVVLDFTTSSAGQFAPGDTVNIAYSTTNVAASASDQTGAAADIPATGQYAWNQFGVRYLDATIGYRKITPSLAGIHLVTGSLAITKTVTGDARAYAPENITASVTCAIGDTALTFDGATTKAVTLTRQPDGSYSTERITGIPLGANCAISEDGDTGSFGEASRSASATNVSISTGDTYATADETGHPTNTTPSSQTVTLTNQYDWGTLSITKQVQTNADKGELGPFTFTLTCATPAGEPVTLDPSDATFTIAAGETHTVTANTVPVRAECTLTEVGSTANTITVVGTNVVDKGDGVSTVTVGPEAAAVTVVNGYDSGVFAVTKSVTGTGAAEYGTGEFGFTATCTYNGQTVLDEAFTLRGGESRTFGTFPAGTECSSQETDAGGATATSATPENQSVTIHTVASDADIPTIAFTNRFDTGSITVTKKLDGDGARAYTSTRFEFTLTCRVNGVDGDPTTFTLKAGQTYVASTIPVGAECRIVETDNGGAEQTRYSVAGGIVTIGSEGERTAVTVTNTFAKVVVSTSASPSEVGVLGNTSASSAILFVALALLVVAAGVGLIAVARITRATGRNE